MTNSVPFYQTPQFYYAAGRLALTALLSSEGTTTTQFAIFMGYMSAAAGFELSMAFGSKPLRTRSGQEARSFFRYFPVEIQAVDLVSRVCFEKSRK